MALPDYQQLMLPTLKLLSDEQEHNARDLVDNISIEFSLSDAEKTSLLPSGKEPTILNRIRWAIFYMRKAGLLETTRRGVVTITKRGLDVLNQKPNKINNNFLMQFAEFVDFRNKSADDSSKYKETILESEEETPEELIEKGSLLINENLADELLKEVRRSDPFFFENIIGKLLSSMGYGEFKPTSRSNDGGVDGIVNQDKLGLDKIYFQAKRYDEGNNISQGQIRDFIGAPELKGANKGIFFTTSNFPKSINSLLLKTPKAISLIDGKELVQLMIDNGIGVRTEKIYKVKKIDYDFFSQTL
jgi:restriction system protein